MIEVPRQRGQRYGPTGGAAMVILGWIACAVLLISVLAQSPSWRQLPVGIAALWVAWVVYLVLWRPRVFLSDDWLILQGMLRDREIAVCSITAVLIGQYTKIVTVTGSYTTPAIAKRSHSVSDAELFEERINQLIAPEPRSVPCTTFWARREAGVLISLTVLLVLSLLARRLLG
ncbi:MAG TPA: hypothetical protein PKA04_07300 [Marmoricola sp.]|nr:hypothetical protein [Marmoricola sp.]